MPGPIPPHNPLAQAAREISAAAREAKSPLLERLGVFAMIGSAIATTGFAAMQMLHMYRRDRREDKREQERERERDRQHERDRPPPDRPGHGDTATAAAGDDRRWTRREEQPESRHAHARQR
jgi:hypothetical protein